MGRAELQKTISGFDNLLPAKQYHPARSPFTKCSNCMARLVVYFMNLPSLLLILLCIFFIIRNYLWETALCYKSMCIVFWGFRYELWKLGVNLNKIP